VPELPEVETTVRELKKEIIGLNILDFWTDWPKAWLITNSKCQKQ
jgi:formamidopyrimidine-DNA glycosylase